jgi:hypothetical protein
MHAVHKQQNQHILIHQRLHHNCTSLHPHASTSRNAIVPFMLPLSHLLAFPLASILACRVAFVASSFCFFVSRFFGGPGFFGGTYFFGVVDFFFSFALYTGDSSLSPKNSRHGTTIHQYSAAHHVPPICLATPTSCNH